MKHYVGVEGVAQEVVKDYIGVAGVARKVSTGYVGVGGVAKQFLQDGVAWEKWSANVSDYSDGRYRKPTYEHSKIGTRGKVVLEFTSTSPNQYVEAYSTYVFEDQSVFGFSGVSPKRYTKDNISTLRYRYYIEQVEANGDASASNPHYEKVWYVYETELSEVTSNGTTKYIATLDARLVDFAFKYNEVGPSFQGDIYYGDVYAYDGKVPIDNATYIRGRVEIGWCIRLIDETYYYYKIKEE